MDTSTHMMYGVGLGSLAMIDPTIASSDITPIYIACILGSNAPDFDYAFKLKGKSTYYKKHRGFSHSLPMIPLWAVLISICFLPIYSLEYVLHLFAWTYLAVTIHVITDLFNIHGTQMLRPITSKWISFDAVPLFDTFVAIMHGVGFILVLTGSHPGSTFLLIYSGILVYYFFRLFWSYRIKKNIKLHFRNSTNLKMIPSMDLISWRIIIETDKDFILGDYFFGKLTVEHTLTKQFSNHEPWIHASKKDYTISNFLASNCYAYPEVVTRKDGLEVRWLDLRFKKNKKFFPFMAISYFPHKESKGNSYVGWFHHPIQYKKMVNKLKRTS